MHGRRGPLFAAITFIVAALGIGLVLMGVREVGPEIMTEVRYRRARNDHDKAMASSPVEHAEGRAQSDANQVGWLSVAGTPIDYPVAQETRDSPGFYLTHDLWGQSSQLGCPYLDWRSSACDTHALIYGHRVGTTKLQFSPIADAWQQEAFDAIGPATFETQTKTLAYSPCLALKVDKSYEQIQRFSLGQEELRTWLGSLLAEATASSPRASELCSRATKALTLATCASSQAGQRERTLLVFVAT